MIVTGRRKPVSSSLYGSNIPRVCGEGCFRYDTGVRQLVSRFWMARQIACDFFLSRLSLSLTKNYDFSLQNEFIIRCEEDLSITNFQKLLKVFDLLS